MLDTLREISVRVPQVKTREDPSLSAAAPDNSTAQSDVQKTPAVVEDVPGMSESGEAKPSRPKTKEPSENGTEEEDEGMVLVGRPT